MIALTIIIILCHLLTLAVNLYRGSISSANTIVEAIVSLTGAVLAGLSLVPSLFAIGLSISFVCFASMFFFNTIRYGMKGNNHAYENIFQYVVYGLSGLGCLSTIIASIVWYCI